jgi:hypothetical protein
MGRVFTNVDIVQQNVTGCQLYYTICLGLGYMIMDWSIPGDTARGFVLRCSAAGGSGFSPPWCDDPSLRRFLLSR